MNDVAARRPHGGAALALVLLLTSAIQARAMEVQLYKATVPLKGATEVQRNAALAEALQIVVVRASGRRDAAGNAVVAARAAQANRLVQQYSATSDQQLRVGFEPATIDEILQDAGLPAWASERPLTLVVMPASGNARTLLAGENTPERTQLEQVAQARGLPLVWPVAETSLDALEAQLHSGGVEAATRAAGTAADAVLIGRDTGGQLEWRLYHVGETAQRRGSAADGAHLAADRLAAIYAPESTRTLSIVDVRVDGVDSLSAYAGLLQVFESLSLVREVAVTEVDRASVQLMLTLRGDLALLRRVAALTPNLRPAISADANGPQFVYLP